MKFDKEIIIGIIICAAVLFGWDPLARYMGWIPTSPAISAPAPAASVPANPAADTPSPPASSPAPAVSEPVLAVPPTVSRPPEILRNRDMKLTIDPVAGQIVSIELLNYLNASQTAPIELDRMLSQAGTGALSVFDPQGSWRVVEVRRVLKEENELKLERRLQNALGQQFTVQQKWSVAPSGYVTQYAVCVINSSASPLNLAIAVNGGGLAPWGALSGDKVRTPSHRMDFLTASGDFTDIKADKSDEKFFVTPPPTVDWAAVSNKYFCVILDAAHPFTLYQARERQVVNGREEPVIAIGSQTGRFQLAPGEVRTLEFSYYSGPKIIALIDDFQPSAGRVMHLAWGPLDYLARLLLWVLVKFHAVLGSYGWSIILLTLVVRILFYPVTAKANASMKKMQAVQPKLTEIRTKYKDNPQLMNTKMMELYRAEGVNPFGGCLPILLQIPVFFALYATLDGAVELRQASFLWCHDLAAADTVARLNLYFFKLPINPLVIAMTALMVIQQHMTPMSMDPMQKKMMMLMPFVMLIFLYDLPSGLTLYWTVSNIFSIIQLRLQQRSRAIPVAAVASAESTSKKGK